MPIYEYRCDDGHTFEVMRRMSDEPLSACEVCGAPVEKVMHPVAVHFKGSGFYTTDYGKKGAGVGAGDAKKDESGGGSEAGSGSDSSGSDSSGSDSSSSDSSSKDAKPSSGSEPSKSSASKSSASKSD